MCIYDTYCRCRRGFPHYHESCEVKNYLRHIIRPGHEGDYAKKDEGESIGKLRGEASGGGSSKQSSERNRAANFFDEKYLNLRGACSMLNAEKWHYNEMMQIGTDYDSEAEVAAYDERMSRFRDFRDEARRIIKALGLKRDQIVLEIGAGTGEIALEISKYCKRVIAIDISRSMLDYVREKANKRDITNITLAHAGFLTYEHTGNPLDAVYTQIALHHLPDFWKMIALKRVQGMLREGGKFYLNDVMFSFPVERYTESINNYISTMKRDAGREIADEICLHIKDEYSTFDWILEEMLRRSGFSIDKVEHKDEFIASYICTKGKGNKSR